MATSMRCALCLPSRRSSPSLYGYSRRAYASVQCSQNPRALTFRRGCGPIRRSFWPCRFGLRTLGVVLGIGSFFSATTLAPVLRDAQLRSIRELWRVGGARMVALGTSTITLAILTEATMGFFGFRTARISLGSEFAN